MLRRLCLLIAATSLSLGAVAVPAAADEAAEDELAQRYAPVMMLVEQDERCGAGEPFVPVAVDPLFDESSIALRGPWTSRDLVAVAPSAEDVSAGLRGYALDQPGDPLRPGCDYEKWADTVWGTDPEPVIYAHVATQRGVEDRIALQYFFYYPFNDFNNKHESDWERIQLEFPVGDVEAALETEPDVVLFAQHYGAERAAWDDEKLQREGDAPVVYVSAGSHASQYDEGLYLGRSSTEGFGCDTTVGPHRTVTPEVRTIPSDPEAAEAAYPWIAYQGHWGELGPQRFYEGPTGPNMKQAWKKPFTWSAKARDDAFNLPGAEAAGSTAATSFCSVVGAGSDAFRAFSADPGPALLVLLAALLLLGAIVRRSGWAEASPLPLVADRRPGGVVAGAWRMLRAHRRAFLGIAAPAALASLVSSAITAYAPASSTAWSALNAVVLLALVLALAWAQVATAQAVADLDEGRTPSLSSLRAATRRRAPALLGTVALWAVILLPLLITGVLSPVAIALVVAWALVLPVVQLEGLSGWRALRRSATLVRRRIPSVLLVLALSFVLVTGLGGLLAALVFIVSPAPFTVVSALPPLVTALVWPVTALLTTYAWASARAREEEREATPS